jgi:hypothetical protein
MTLEEYFRDALSKGQIDHALRVQIGPSGQPEFYLHPTVSGNTLDFVVEGNVLHPRGWAVATSQGLTVEDAVRLTKAGTPFQGTLTEVVPTGGATLTVGP